MASTVAELEKLYLENVVLMERLSRFVCRCSRMTTADVEDFSSHVKLKLFENDYSILEKFQGRCSLASYLTIVIQRLLTEFRIQQGARKWRKSAEATRLGTLATRLETLLHRDHLSLGEAFQVLRASGENVTLASLELLAARFPTRAERPRMVSIEDTADALAVSVSPESFETDAVRSDRLAACWTIAHTVRDELRRLPQDDLMILRLHFYGGLSIAEIARILRRKQKPLYRHVTRLCRRFRERLVEAGIDDSVAADLIGRADTVFDFEIDGPGNLPTRPSSTSGPGRQIKEPSVK